jgi:hypothetical protein
MALTPTDPTKAQAWIRGTAPDLTVDLYVPRGARGDKGEPGDLVNVTTGTWGAVVVLSAYPQTYVSSLTTSVTSLSLPNSAIATQSGTITLVLTQDSTGGRTIAWPSVVKWPDGIAQQPAGGPNTTSIIHLLWTGQQWLGMIGGKSFA